MTTPNSAERAHAAVSISGLRSICATPAAAMQGLVAVDVGGALGLQTRVNELELNRVVGLGVAQPANTDVLDELDRVYGRERLPYLVQLHPCAEPADLSDMLTARHFEHFPSWSVLMRGTTEPAAVERSGRDGAPVRVVRAKADDTDLIARILGQSFGLPIGERALFGATVGLAGWHHYLASIGDEPVGAAAMHVSEAACLFGGSATLPGHRGLGVQSALIECRVRAAIVAGCEVLFVETQIDVAGEEPAELRNVIRAGFAPAFKLRSFGYRRGFRQRYDQTTRSWH